MFNMHKANDSKLIWLSSFTNYAGEFIDNVEQNVINYSTDEDEYLSDTEACENCGEMLGIESPEDCEDCVYPG